MRTSWLIIFLVGLILGLGTSLIPQLGCVGLILFIAVTGFSGWLNSRQNVPGGAGTGAIGAVVATIAWAIGVGVAAVLMHTNTSIATQVATQLNDPDIQSQLKQAGVTKEQIQQYMNIATNPATLAGCCGLLGLLPGLLFGMIGGLIGKTNTPPPPASYPAAGPMTYQQPPYNVPPQQGSQYQQPPYTPTQQPPYQQGQYPPGQYPPGQAQPPYQQGQGQYQQPYQPGQQPQQQPYQPPYQPGQYPQNPQYPQTQYNVPPSQQPSQGTPQPQPPEEGGPHGTGPGESRNPPP